MEIRLECEDCGWVGLQEDCYKGYREIPNTGGDVEPFYECPKCNSEKLVELAGRGEEVQMPLLVPA